MLRTRGEFLEIVDAVCAEFGVDPAAISSITRGKAVICHARDVICLIANGRGFSKAGIGRMINRDKSTVAHAIANAVSAIKAAGAK